MLYAVSYGNGNDGLSRLHCDFTVEAPEGSEDLIAKLAMLSLFSGAARRYVSANLSIDESGSDAAQAVVLDPPGRDGRGWSEHNGAWKLADAYPASEATNADERPSYETLEAAFGRQLVVAHRPSPVASDPVASAIAETSPPAPSSAFPHVVVVKRDGTPLWGNVCATYQDADSQSLAYLHKVCGYSASHAILHEGYTVEITPSDSPRRYGDEHERQRWQEHFDKYDNLAHVLSIPALRSLVPFSREEILAALSRGDEHLNSLQLKRWDACDYVVRRFAVESGKRSWSLCETVCVLKHVAKHYVATNRKV